MKKFMFIAMVVASAGLTQASSIQWNAAGGSGLGTGAYIYAMTGTASDYTAVLALLATGNVAGFQSYYASMDQLNAFSTGSIGANSHVALGAGVTASGMLAFNSPGAYGLLDNFVGGSQQGVFFVIFDDSNPLNAGYYSVSARTVNNLGATGATNFASPWGSWGGTGVNGNTTWMPIVNIPEPTAMALLALGAAALGLRRRFRK